MTLLSCLIKHSRIRTIYLVASLQDYQLIKKLIPSSSIQQYVAKMYITRGLKDIIEKGQKKCAAKKRKIPRITNKEIQRDAAKK